MGDYGREWARFSDWCTAVGRTALPATEGTVLSYLADEAPSAGTAGRWVAAIRARHRGEGAPDPCLGTVTALLRSSRAGGRPDPDGLLASVKGPLRSMPLSGWPAGLFGRRDRLAFLLSRVGAFSVPALLELATDDVAVRGPGTVEVSRGAGTLVLEAGAGDPEVCLACAVTRWGWALGHADLYATRELAAKLSHTSPQAVEHACARQGATGRPWGPGQWPLFPPMDRWGAFPTRPVPAMSVRAMEGVLRAIARGEMVRTAVRVPGWPAGAEQPEAAAPAAEAPAPSAGELRLAHEAGLASRAKAKESLAQLDSDFDDLDQETDELAARIQRLLDQASAR